MTLMVALPIDVPPSQYIHVWLRALVCGDAKLDLIIGLPSIQFYDLLQLLNTHLATTICCEICVKPSHNRNQATRRTASVTFGPTGKNNQGATHTSVNRSYQDGPLPICLPPHHSTYTEPIGDHGRQASCGS